jgi:HEAT repeats/TIR domain
MREIQEFDVFISHVEEDHDIVLPLVDILRFDYSLRVWYDDDKDVMGAGSIRQSIDSGLKRSRCGVVIVSPSSISQAKGYFGEELDVLMAKAHKTNEEVFFPVWVNIDRERVEEFSLVLATKQALRIRKERKDADIPRVAYQLAQWITKSRLTEKIERYGETQQIEAVNKMGTAGFNVLLHLLNDHDIGTRLTAIRKLGEMRDARAIGALFRVIRQITATNILEIRANRDNYLLLVTTTDALTKIGKVAARSLIQALKDECWLVRWVALSALWKAEDPAVVLPLTTRLQDTHVDIRSDAAYVLGDIGDSKAIEPLKVALNDSDERVRVNVKEALDRIKGSADEREKAMLHDLCKAAREASSDLETPLGFVLFDQSDELKRDVAQSLAAKGYIEILTKDYMLRLKKPKGYDFCMKLQAPAYSPVSSV